MDREPLPAADRGLCRVNARQGHAQPFPKRDGRLFRARPKRLGKQLPEIGIRPAVTERFLQVVFSSGGGFIRGKSDGQFRQSGSAV